QIIVASNVLENQKIWYYFPMLFFSGIIAGTMIGFLGYSICKKIKKINRM
ncbi:MAG: Gx transporter family protein, partial [Lachnospiraceae bacterium]|nr:Gx transporter family protein [Lachnospiraceae bacterium]